MKVSTIIKFGWDIIVNPKSLLELNKWYFYFSKRNVKTPLDYEIPWMTFTAIEYLKVFLNKNMNVFEYGSGGSTLFFTKRANHVISIEHDKCWYEYEIDILNKINNLNLILIEPEENGFMKNYRSGYENKFFDKYVNFIESNDNMYDIIIVDGRQRNDCFKKALHKIKNNGIIVFDNFDRGYYSSSLNLINQDEWIIKHFKGFVPFGTMQSQTTIFRKKNYV